MKRLLLAAILLALGAMNAAAEAPRARLAGGEVYTLPDWFKPSLLEIPQELKEAAAQNRHLLLFLHLDECPYCARLLAENFRDGSNKAFMQEHFDVIALNVRGASEVEWVDGKRYTERQLSVMLKVFATPTLIFLDAGGRVVLKLNGYRHPRPFRQALAYVHGRHYARETLAEYAARQPAEGSYDFRRHPLFTTATDFAGYREPLAIVFEDRNCADCEEWHRWVFNRPDVFAELKNFRVVRLDAASGQPIVDLAGRRTSPRAWAKALNLTYRPGIALFNEGEVRAIVDGMLYKFHFRELLRYVSGRYYQGGTTSRAYMAVRRDELLRQGITIDFSR